MNKYKIAVTALLAFFCLSAAACLFSLVYATLNDWSRQQRLKKFAEYQRQEKQQQALENEFREWQRLPQDLQKFRKDYFVSMDEFAAFRRSLESSLDANQLQPQNIRFTFGNLSDNIKKVSMSFSLEGNYRNVKKFIFDQGKKSKLYFIKSLQLSPGAGTVKGNFMLEVYLGQ